MFGLSKREKRQKRYTKIRAIARRQGRVSFDLTDMYLDALAFDVLDLIIAANYITDEQFVEMGIPDSILAEYDAPTETLDVLDDNAAKAEALDEYTRVFDERRDAPLEQPAEDYHRATSIPEPVATPEPVRETPTYSSDDDSTRRSSGSGSSLGSSSWGDDSSSSSSSSDSGGSDSSSSD